MDKQNSNLNFYDWAFDRKYIIKLQIIIPALAADAQHLGLVVLSAT